MSKLTKALTAAAGSAGGGALYVEDVFSTYLYDGTGAAHTITNGIDLAGEGGLVWGKRRNLGNSHWLLDTERGAGNKLRSNGTLEQTDATAQFPSFNSNGFTVATADNEFNNSAGTYASWTFRKAKKFFDVVTYTGDGTSGREIAHSLNGTVGSVMIKVTSTTSNWFVWHRSLNQNGLLLLNLINAVSTDGVITASSNTTVTLENWLNSNGKEYVMYLFAHDAGGFGEDEDESIISCGSVTTDGSGNASVDVGFEPQWCLWKCVDAAGGNEHGNWRINDTMRGWPASSPANAFGFPSTLYANTSGAETISGVDGFIKSATGFGFGQVQANKTYIYIAIRRPMKTPESGTEVFAMDTLGATAPNPPRFTSGFPVDMSIDISRTTTAKNFVTGRLVAKTILNTATTNAEVGGETEETFDYMDGWNSGGGTSTDILSYMFKRATGFFDVVAYTGTGSATTQAHNLGVVPEMMWIKRRDNSGNWMVYGATPNPEQKYLVLNLTDAADTASWSWNNTSPTATNFALGTGSNVNGSGGTFIAYLFATLDGVSKVGSYTGTGADLNIDCGFTAGARFILIKRTDVAGDWYVYDSFRGISAGNDPYKVLNTQVAEVTGTDYIDPLNAGFTVTSTAPAGLNASGGTYIFLAIA